MPETLSILPFPFWVVMTLLVAGAVQAFRQLHDGSGLPSLVVLGTVTAWYVGDAFYNDYLNYHAKVFKADILQDAWWQVACFVAVFLFVTPLIHRHINKLYLRRTSGLLQLFKHGVGDPWFQKQLTQLFYGCFWLWLVISLIATVRLGNQIKFYFFPFLGDKAEAWGRDRIGSGFSALLTAIFYLQILVTGIFGVVAALATSGRILLFALGCCILSWPYFIFDRTRNTLLAIAIPGIISFCLLRLRGGWLVKSAALFACFMVVNAWMGFIMASRASGEVSVVEALTENGFNFSQSGQVHHEGLNMYEELCWINNLTRLGMYHPNWGGRYYAELVNVIPRALWHGKPLIGLDYAIARGQKGESGSGGGVNATMSTGMMGQGVVNFGPIIGPAFAAVLMSLWVAWLARIDLNILKLGYLPLYASGLILTFNLGRDITLLTLYPFVFGWFGIWWLRIQSSRTSQMFSRNARHAIPAPQSSGVCQASGVFPAPDVAPNFSVSAPIRNRDFSIFGRRRNVAPFLKPVVGSAVRQPKALFAVRKPRFPASKIKAAL